LRPSVAILSGTPVRLAELRFPARRVQIQRTRLAFIHLDNLLHFAKIDRDGKIDGYIAAYLPDELALLFLRNGEVVTSVAFTGKGREVRPIAVTLKSLRDELERGELAFCEAPLEQLVWMYHSVAGPAQPRSVNPRDPRSLFLALQNERYSGVLELIVNGAVSYLRFEDGKFLTGHFAGKDADEQVPGYLERLFAAAGPDGRPVVVAAGFAPGATLEEQASPAMVQAYREVFWRIAEAAEREVPGEAMSRALKLKDRLVPVHDPLRVLATPRERDLEPRLFTAEGITYGLSDWALQLLEQLEVIAPGVAGQVLKDATRDHRYVLQRAGFFSRLPWPVTW
jgi:hypothetical protein